MAFDPFKIILVLRIIGFTLTVVLAIYLGAYTKYYISTFSLGLIALLQIWSLVAYVDKANGLFVKFLDAIRYDDFSQTYSPQGLGKSFDKLNQEFSKVLEKFQEVSADREAQYKYLEAIVQHIAIGLIVFDENGKIRLCNDTALSLLNIKYLKDESNFKEEHLPLVNYIRKLKKEAEETERKLIRLKIKNTALHLAVRSKNLILRGENFFIVSLQDIQTELEEKEMEAWQKLIRVLTHEIINSVTPISSLSATLNENLEEHQTQLETQESAQENGTLNITKEYLEDSLGEVHMAVRAIQRRSEGLIHFVKDFRNLTKIPTPDLQPQKLKELLESILFLMKEDLKKQGVEVQIQITDNLEVMADAHLLEQVFINLIKNAAQAMESSEKVTKQIDIQAVKNTWGKVRITVEDNGSGISPEALESIFVPFFTTKKTGSGIGLSLSRQIMRLHGGNISVNSTLGEGSIFTLVLP